MAIPNPYQPPTAKNPPGAGGIPGPALIPSPYTSPSASTTPTTPTTAPVAAPTTVPNPHRDWIDNPASGQGGIDNYTKTQNARWQDANKTGNAELMSKLQEDSNRVGYKLDPYSPPAPNTTAPAGFADWQAKTSELLGKYETLLNASTQYNPETDPKYQAFRQLSNSRAADAAKGANSATLEQMNSRGILNSSVTASQLSQNENRYRQQAETEALAAVPQFEAASRSEYQDKLRNAGELLKFATGRGDTAYQQEYTAGRDARTDAVTDRNFDQTVKESDRNYNRGVFESDRTYDAQQAAQAWDQAFSEEQFDWNKAQKIWENAFQEMNFEQQMQEAAASRGLQWASLSQRDKEFIADEAFRDRQLSWAQDANNPDNVYKTAQTTALENKAAEPAAEKIDNKQSAADHDYLIDQMKANKSLTRQQAFAYLDANKDSLIDADYRKLREWITLNKLK